jgi:predicted flap endonuclease-1-like 5' DNA nuclease
MENFTSDLLFIIIVLVGAAILGFLIGYFVNARYKKVMAAIDDLKKDMDKMQAQINDLVSFKEKHISEYESIKSDLTNNEDSIKELQKLISGIDELKKKIEDHSHDSLGKELSAIRSKLTEIDERTAPVAFNPERAEKALGRKIKEDDLTVIEGIGPKIAEILNKYQISTWQALAQSTPETLKAMLLKEGGDSYAVHDPASWPAQANMASEGKWELLKEYQDYMVGGVSPDKG